MDSYSKGKMKSESSRQADGKSKGKKEEKTGKGLGKRKIEEKRRNGKEGVREQRKKADATKSIFIEKVSSNYQCIYSKGHCLKKQ